MKPLVFIVITIVIFILIASVGYAADSNVTSVTTSTSVTTEPTVISMTVNYDGKSGTYDVQKDADGNLFMNIDTVLSILGGGTSNYYMMHGGYRAHYDITVLGRFASLNPLDLKDMINSNGSSWVSLKNTGYQLAIAFNIDSEKSTINIEILPSDQAKLPKDMSPLLIDRTHVPDNFKLVLHIDSDTAEVNDKSVPIDAAPYIASTGRTLIPVRFISEALGAYVDWRPENREISIGYTDVYVPRYWGCVSMTLGSKTYTTNNTSKEMEQCPEIKNGRTMIPVRALMDALGMQTEWDASTRSITITRQPSKYY